MRSSGLAAGGGASRPASWKATSPRSCARRCRSSATWVSDEMGSMIALAPVGDVPMAEVEALVPVLSEAFGAEVVLAPAVSLPPTAYDARRRQHRSTVILDALARARRPQWERLLGVTDVDLFVPDLNFVFGEADSSRGVAVFSTIRLHSPDAALFRRRAATE